MTVLAIIYAIAGILDYITTVIGLSMGATENNPLMAALVDAPILFFLVKMSATFAISYVLIRLGQKMQMEDYPVFDIALSHGIVFGFVTFQWLIVFNNWGVICALS